MKTRRRKQEGPSGSQLQPGLLRLYAACISNAEDLLAESELLFETLHYARAYALAFTALEETGKAHVVADFYSGVASTEEIVKAFRRHELKTAYLQRRMALDHGSKEGVIEYDETTATQTFNARNAALYVDYGIDFAPVYPSDVITEVRAKDAIDQVKKELYDFLVQDYMGHQIGSKGRFK